MLAAEIADTKITFHLALFESGNQEVQALSMQGAFEGSLDVLALFPNEKILYKCLPGRVDPEDQRRILNSCSGLPQDQQPVTIQLDEDEEQDGKSP